MIVFLHIPKTAGSTFQFILENTFGLSACHGSSVGEEKPCANNSNHRATEGSAFAPLDPANHQRTYQSSGRLMCPMRPGTLVKRDPSIREATLYHSGRKFTQFSRP